MNAISIKDSYEQAKGNIYPHLIKEVDEYENSSVDTAVLKITENLLVYFLYTDEENLIERAVTKEDLVKWNVSVETVANDAASNGCEVTPFVWDKFKELNFYKYPENDDGWISQLLMPQALLEHNFTQSTPIIIIHDFKKVFLTEEEVLSNNKDFIKNEFPLFNERQSPIAKLRLTENEAWESIL